MQNEYQPMDNGVYLLNNSNFVSCKSLASTPRNRTTRAFAAATFGLRLALRLFEKTNNDVTPTSTVSNTLLHVRPPRAERIACSESFYLLLQPLRL